MGGLGVNAAGAASLSGPAPWRLAHGVGSVASRMSPIKLQLREWITYDA